MKLYSKARFGFEGEPVLVLIESKDSSCRFKARNIGHHGMAEVCLSISDFEEEPKAGEVVVPAELRFLGQGDIIRLNPKHGEIRVLYRRASHHNTLFVTERCNSRCLMCAQPPRDVDDCELVDEILQMLPWMAKETTSLGITGGEPTLLYEKLPELIGAAKGSLPDTALHVLSNGRLFAYAKSARQIAVIGHPDLMIGIPLYSDIAQIHDFVVQARGAFEQTIYGILNLARVGVRVELRIVVHRLTYERLPKIARFISHNLPFVEQVVLMGLEATGFARSNYQALWIDPTDYQAHLEGCVRLLDDAGLRVSIYNHQLCRLRPSLHRFASKAISDWKNVFVPGCEPCMRRNDCGGFFATDLSREIH